MRAFTPKSAPMPKAAGADWPWRNAPMYAPSQLKLLFTTAGTVGVSTTRSAAKAAEESTAVAADASKASLRERIVKSFTCLNRNQHGSRESRAVSFFFLFLFL